MLSNSESPGAPFSLVGQCGISRWLRINIKPLLEIEAKIEGAFWDTAKGVVNNLGDRPHRVRHGMVLLQLVKRPAFAYLFTHSRSFMASSCAWRYFDCSGSKVPGLPLRLFRVNNDLTLRQPANNHVESCQVLFNALG